MTTTVLPIHEKSAAMVDMHIGKRVRHRRWLLGMTQTQLADLIGVSFQQVQKYESGKNRVAASTLFAIARVMGTDVNYFLPYPPKDVEA